MTRLQLAGQLAAGGYNGTCLSNTEIYAPTLTITIVGSGTVNSCNGQGLNYACAPASCQAVSFGTGDTVTLYPIRSNSTFNAWSSDYFSTNNPGGPFLN